MTTITTRSGKGSPLTNSEVDANFTNLNTDKLELSGGTLTGDLQATGLYVGATNTSYDFYNNGTTYLNGATTIDANTQINGNLTLEDGQLYVGNVSADNWTRVRHIETDGYGFDWQHGNASVIVNEQGSTNQALILGDVDAGDYTGLLGVAHSTSGGGSWTKKLDLRGNGELYIGSSGTSKVWHQGNDGSGSGLDADLLDGVHGSSFLRSDADDSATGFIDFTTGSRFGTLNVGGVNSSGASYDRTIQPEDNSNLYLNYDGGGVVITNSANSSGYLQDNQSVRAPIFYDSDNTAYYTNPASSSVLHQTTTNWLGVGTTANSSGSDRLNMGGNIDMNNHEINYLHQVHFNDGVRFLDEGNDNYLRFRWNDTGGGAIKFYDGNDLLHGHVYGDGSGGFGLLDKDEHWFIYTNGTDQTQIRANNNVELYVYTDHVVAPGSFRAPIFYDSDNTGFYTDPNNDSRMARLNVGDASNYIIIGDESAGFNTSYAQIRTTSSGALRIDSKRGQDLYLNWYNNLATHVISESPFRSPVYYDRNDTAYYTNPADSSNLNKWKSGSANGNSTAPRYDTSAYVLQSQHWYGHNSGQGMYLGEAGNDVYVRGQMAIGGTAIESGYALTMTGDIDMNSGGVNYLNQLHFADNVRFVDEGNDQYLRYKAGDTGGFGIKFYNGSDQLHGYVYGDGAGSNFGLLVNDSSWAVQCTTGKTSIYHRLDTPIMYDQDNTSYYVDPASTSVVNQVIATNVEFGDSSGPILSQERDQNLKLQGSSGNDVGITGYSSNGTWSLQLYGHQSGQQGFLKSNWGSWAAYADSSGNWFGTTSVRSLIFYDTNDTTYYVNPASTGSSVRIKGNIDTRTQDSTTQNNQLYFGINNGNAAGTSNNIGSGITWAPLYSSYSKRSAGILSIGEGNYFRSGLAFYTNNTADVSTDWSERMRLDMDGNLINYVSVRAPIYYDSGNTAYFTSPAGYSKVNALLVGNQTTQVANTTFGLQVHHNNRYLISLNYSGQGGNYPWLIHDSYNSTGAFIIHFNAVGDKFQFTQAGDGFAASSLRAPIFYDSNNTSFYIHPDSNSRMAQITVDGGTGNSSTDGTVYVTATNNNDWGLIVDKYNGNSSEYGVDIRMGSSFSYGFRVLSAGSAVSGISSAQLYHNSSVRGPIFYDSANTSYYVDPASTSRLSQIDFGDSSPTLSQNGVYLKVATSYGYIELGPSNSSYAHINTDRPTFYFNQSVTVDGGGIRMYDSGADVRAFAFYDQANTAYYFDGSATGDSIRVAGNIVAYYSDERLKDIEGNIDSPLEKVSQLNGFYYKANKKAQTLGYKDNRQVGVSAQEVEAVMPEVVTDAAIGHGYKTVDYAKLVPLLIEAVKEQQDQIETLKSRLEKLEN